MTVFVDDVFLNFSADKAEWFSFLTLGFVYVVVATTFGVVFIDDDDDIFKFGLAVIIDLGASKRLFVSEFL